MKVSVQLDLNVADAVVTDRMFAAKTRTLPRAEQVVMAMILERISDVFSVAGITLSDETGTLKVNASDDQWLDLVEEFKDHNGNVRASSPDIVLHVARRLAGRRRLAA